MRGDHDAFADLVRASTDDPDAWDAWLYRLTVRACYRVAGKERRRHVVELSAAPDHGRSGPDHAVALADRDHRSRALGALPIDQRAVVVAHFYLGLPISGAAAVLGIPAGTCKSRLARALGALWTSMVTEPDVTGVLGVERGS